MKKQLSGRKNDDDLVMAVPLVLFFLLKNSLIDPALDTLHGF
jgi:hypothetical protein